MWRCLRLLGSLGRKRPDGLGSSLLFRRLLWLCRLLLLGFASPAHLSLLALLRCDQAVQQSHQEAGPCGQASLHWSMEAGVSRAACEGILAIAGLAGKFNNAALVQAFQRPQIAWHAVDTHVVMHVTHLEGTEAAAGLAAFGWLTPATLCHFRTSALRVHIVTHQAATCALRAGLLCDQPVTNMKRHTQSARGPTKCLPQDQSHPSSRPPETASQPH